MKYYLWQNGALLFSVRSSTCRYCWTAFMGTDLDIQSNCFQQNRRIVYDSYRWQWLVVDRLRGCDYGYTDFIFINRFEKTQHQGTLNKAIRRIIRNCRYAAPSPLSVHMWLLDFLRLLNIIRNVLRFSKMFREYKSYIIHQTDTGRYRYVLCIV